MLTPRSEEKKKALLYAAIICGTLLLLFILIKWTIVPPSEPIVQEQIEINLGNEKDGFGEKQPLIKGSPTTTNNEPQSENSSSSNNDNITPDDNNNSAAAVVNKTDNNKKTTTPVNNENKKTATENKTKIELYKGNNTGKNGNNEDIDNGFKSQGNNPNGNNDQGKSNGSPKVIPINRAMLKDYKFEDELGKEKIYARIKINTSGAGTFVKIEKKSTSFDTKYKNAIINCLPKIKFESSDANSEAIIIFDFRVN
jgi:hypothetical protein